jgi:uncharacterized protein YyaL (SSP411 family)
LYQARPVEDAEDRTDLAAARAILLAVRSNRVRPHLDDKVLTAWNALMISAFAKGAQILGDPLYGQAARRAMEFVLRHLYDPERTTLLRRFRQGEAAIPGFLDDYAFLIIALLDLYETHFEPYHLELAAQLAGRMAEQFEDPESGGFFSTPAGDSNLILRMKDDYDGAEPSGNSMAASALLRLAHMTGKDEFRQSAERALRAFSGRIAAIASGMPQMLVAITGSLAPPRQIVLTGPKDEAGPMLETVRRHFLPDTVVFVLDGEDRSALARYNPVLASMKPLEGAMTAYVCENFACRLPTTEVDKLDELLQ